MAKCTKFGQMERSSKRRGKIGLIQLQKAALDVSEVAGRPYIGIAL